MLGNEGFPMSKTQMEICDFFVHIPQLSTKGAKLSEWVAASIVLHHFALFANFQETPMEGQKFELQARRGKLERYENPNEVEREEMDRKRQDRREKMKVELESGRHRD